MYFLIALEVEVQDQGVGRFEVWLAEATFSLCPHIAFSLCADPWNLFLKGHLFYWLRNSTFISSLKIHFQTQSHWGLEVYHKNVGGTPFSP